MKSPLVSVAMITYGHEDYIKQAVQSILAQQCDFEIELIIANDHSPDNTDDIIQQLLKDEANSSWIKYTNHEKNIGIVPNFVFSLEQCKGNYIAICEGDDYWNDPLKLQKQVAYLEQNPDCSLCFHPATHLNETHPEQSFIHRPMTIPENGKFGMTDAILGGGGFITTNAMVFRQECIQDMPDWFLKAPVADLPLMLLLATKGKIGYLNEVMSTYRLLTQNSWSTMLQNRAKKKKHFDAVSKMWNNFDKGTGYKYHWIIVRKKMKNRYSYWKQILYLQKQIILKKVKAKR